MWRYYEGTDRQRPHHLGEWESEFDSKFGHMISHRIGHYNLQHYKDIGRDATKEETDNSFKYADSDVARLKDFIAQTIKNREREIAGGIEKLRRGSMSSIELAVIDSALAFINKPNT